MESKPSQCVFRSKTVMLLALGIGCIYFFITTQSSLWDRDEPRYARATVEMVDSGDYLVPTFNGVLRPHKPPLVYWLMSVPLRLFGPHEFAFRLPSVLATVVTSLLVYFIAMGIFDPRTAFWSVLVFAFDPMSLVVGSAATTDAILLASMTGVVAVLVWCSGTSRIWLPMFLMTLAVALGWLAKGPVALLVTLSVWLAIAFARGYRIPAKRSLLVTTLSLLFGVAVFLAWAIPANNATEGEFYRQGVGLQVFERILHPLESHGGQSFIYWGYYIGVILVGFFPWTLFLPVALVKCLSSSPTNPFRPFFLAWTVPTLVIMTLVATKLPHYVYFTWPAFALCIARAITDPSGQPDGRAPRGLMIGQWLFGLSVLAILLLSILIPLLIEIPGIALASILLGVFWLIGMIWVLTVQDQRCYSRAATVLVAVILATLLPVLFGIVPALEKSKIAPQIARIVGEQVPEEVPVAACGYTEPSLNFYIGRSVRSLSNYAEVESWISAETSGLLLFLVHPGEHPPDHSSLIPIGTVNGFNYVTGRNSEVQLFLRGSAPAKSDQ